MEIEALDFGVRKVEESNDQNVNELKQLSREPGGGEGLLLRNHELKY
jgi:hypothetical protein